MRGTVLFLLSGFHFQEPRETLRERIIKTHSLHLNNSAHKSIITNIRSLHLNELRVRMIFTTRSFHRTTNGLLSAA